MESAPLQSNTKSIFSQLFAKKRQISKHYAGRKFEHGSKQADVYFAFTTW